MAAGTSKTPSQRLVDEVEASLPGDGEAVTIAQAAQALAISVSTAKKLAARGELPGILPKVGSQWRVSRRLLAEFLAGRMNGVRNGRR